VRAFYCLKFGGGLWPLLALKEPIITDVTVRYLGKLAIRIPTDSINKYQKSDQYIQFRLGPLIALSRPLFDFYDSRLTAQTV
jgi:hypothetical protein